MQDTEDGILTPMKKEGALILNHASRIWHLASRIASPARRYTSPQNGQFSTTSPRKPRDFTFSLFFRSEAGNA